MLYKGKRENDRIHLRLGECDLGFVTLSIIAELALRPKIAAFALFALIAAITFRPGRPARPLRALMSHGSLQSHRPLATCRAGRPYGVPVPDTQSKRNDGDGQSDDGDNADGCALHQCVTGSAGASSARYACASPS